MYEGREEQINWEKLPPSLDDFPDDMQKAVLTFNMYGDRYNEAQYIGKDFALLNLVIETEHISNKELYISTLLKMDEFYREKSQKDVEAASRRKQ